MRRISFCKTQHTFWAVLLFSRTLSFSKIFLHKMFSYRQTYTTRQFVDAFSSESRFERISLCSINMQDKIIICYKSIPFYIKMVPLMPFIPFFNPIYYWFQIRKSVVKLFVQTSTPNYCMPWQMKRQQSCTGSGFVISGRRILTNAHVTAYQKSVNYLIILLINDRINL